MVNQPLRVPGVEVHIGCDFVPGIIRIKIALSASSAINRGTTKIIAHNYAKWQQCNRLLIIRGTNNRQAMVAAAEVAKA